MKIVRWVSHCRWPWGRPDHRFGGRAGAETAPAAGQAQDAPPAPIGDSPLADNPSWRFRVPPPFRPATGPRYRLSYRLAGRVVWASLRGRQRDIRVDGRYLTARMRPQPVVRGLEHLPEVGPCVILPNHYERPDGVWVGWAAIVMAATLAAQRPRMAPMRWVMTATWQDCYLGPKRIPPGWLRWVLRRFAAVYGLLLMPAVYDATIGRAGAVRELLQTLENGHREVIALHPEGGGFETLVRPPCGIGRVLSAIDRRGISLIPAGVCEADGRLTIQFGPRLPPGSLGRLADAEAADRAMMAIAQLVPPATRGAYADRAIGPRLPGDDPAPDQ